MCPRGERGCARRGRRRITYAANMSTSDGTRQQRGAVAAPCPYTSALLEEEVASVRGFLAIEQVRFEERLDARTEIEPAALRCEVPAFLLNPLVENAVKHGVAGTANAPLVLRVEARLVQPDRLRLVVENTGRWAARSTDAPNADENDDSLP